MFVTKQQPKNKTNVVTDFRRCLICQKDLSDVLNNLTKRGLPRFQEAMLEHNDEVYERLRHDITDDDQFLLKKTVCHRGCRSEYTHKRHSDFQVKRQKLDTSVPDALSSRNIATVDYKTRCFLCKKERDKKGVRTLILISEQGREEHIHRRVKELADKELMIAVEAHCTTHKDMIAADFSYHRSYMSRFMLSKLPSDVKGNQNYDSAFVDLVNEIKEDVLKKRAVYYMTQVRDRYKEHQIYNGVLN